MNLQNQAKQKNTEGANWNKEKKQAACTNVTVSHLFRDLIYHNFPTNFISSPSGVVDKHIRIHQKFQVNYNTKSVS
jgi:hypothetical protein